MPQDVSIVTMLGLLPVENGCREIRDKILASIREAAVDEGVKSLVFAYGGPPGVDAGSPERAPWNAAGQELLGRDRQRISLVR